MRLGIAPVQWGGLFSETLKECLLAEELGYDSVWILEHHFTKVGYFPSPLLVLASIASHTSRVRLGTGVLLAPFRNPVKLAEDSAMVHVISKGRLLLGLGTGYRHEEFDAFGADRSRRLRSLREAVTRCKELWSGRDVLGRSGSEPLALSPGLEGIRGPPVWVGGYGDSSLAVAADMGDAWLPGPVGALETLRQSLSKYREFLRANGRSWEEQEHPLMRDVFVAQTSEEAAAVYSGPIVRMYEEDYGAWRHRLVKDRSLTLEDLRDRCLVGSPDDVIEQVEQLKKSLGTDLLICRMRLPGVSHEQAASSMRLMSAEVAPAIQD